VIPAFNEESQLQTCLDHIAAQSERPDEVIVVNNNSTDRTVAIAREYNFVRVIDEAKQGIVFARDAGFNAATSDIIGRIDADSRLSPDWVAHVKQWFRDHPDCAAVTGDCTFYDFSNPLFRRLHHFGYYNVQRVVSGGHILWGSNMALTRAAWQDVKTVGTGNETVQEDIELSIQLQNKGYEIMRDRTLQAAVSLRRGDIGPVSIVRYLRRWPRTYFATGRPIQGVAILIILLITWLLVIPPSGVYWLLKRIS
jgi:cellulose synthase/poly-beta-1,6-N-acetylglucosamine synthase-like glycosyltransferase